MYLDKVFDDDDNGDDSLLGWGIKILTLRRSFLCFVSNNANLKSNLDVIVLLRSIKIGYDFFSML
jgi:hypothetical protein